MSCCHRYLLLTQNEIESGNYWLWVLNALEGQQSAHWVVNACKIHTASLHQVFLGKWTRQVQFSFGLAIWIFGGLAVNPTCRVSWLMKSWWRLMLHVNMLHVVFWFICICHYLTFKNPLLVAMTLDNPMPTTCPKLAQPPIPRTPACCSAACGSCQQTVQLRLPTELGRRKHLQC